MSQKVLLTTIHQPLGIESETCTRNIQAEMYHAQVTLSQGPFSIRAVCTGWGLDFIAVNLKVPTTVLHYPTLRRLEKELQNGYDFIGIGFTICTFPKVVEICRIVRQQAPNTKIVLGGYGTVLAECDNHADYVCREEGVNYFKRLLGENKVAEFKLPIIKRRLKVLSINSGPSLTVPTGLGCSRGCDFCCTSHFFKRKYYPLVKSGKEIHDFICSVNLGRCTYRDVSFIDEDFLMDRDRAMEMAIWNARELEQPILFSCLTSLKSITQYTTEELLSMGLAGVWVGIESKRADYGKLKNVAVANTIHTMKKAGISVLTSMIIGYDWHDEQGVEDDFKYLISLRPTLSQLMIYSPCPQTPLYEKLLKSNRLLTIPYKYHDGFHVLFKHPHFSAARLERLLINLFEREYEELGPCIFRVLEVQLNGYEAYKESPHPLMQRRALEHKRMCQQFYPLLALGIAKAPSPSVKDFIRTLRDRIENAMIIPYRKRLMRVFVPFLYHYTKIHDTLIPYHQPVEEVHRYHYS